MLPDDVQNPTFSPYAEHSSISEMRASVGTPQAYTGQGQFCTLNFQHDANRNNLIKKATIGQQSFNSVHCFADKSWFYPAATCLVRFFILYQTT